MRFRRVKPSRRGSAVSNIDTSSTFRIETLSVWPDFGEYQAALSLNGWSRCSSGNVVGKTKHSAEFCSDWPEIRNEETHALREYIHISQRISVRECVECSIEQPSTL